MDLSTIEDNFTYHPASEDQIDSYDLIRKRAKELALFLYEECPHSREKQLALINLEQVVFWANASIARNT